MGIFVNPKNWNSSKQMAIPINTENNQINTELSLIKQEINQAFLYLKVQEKSFDVEDIFKQYKGETISKDYGLLEFYQLYLEKQKKLVGLEIKQVTWNKFDYIKNDIEEFIKDYYKKSDIKLKDLDFQFITEFEFYLKTEKKHKQITINKALQRFKKVIKQATIGKYIDNNPFEEHKPKKVISKIVFLTKEELERLENYHFSSKTLNVVKDCYLFCCYTGLAYKEMFELKKENIINNQDDNLWIFMKREKTDRNISVPLVLPKALEIAKKYQSESEYILPRISNQSFNRLLKEIASTLNINKNLTHHTARKTFASTILLNNDIPMEVVSKLLGHSKISTTQEYYADVLPNKLVEQMKKLSIKLK
ncbi:integrase [Bergeyella porcorum]|uniref:Integrase n=2 Tax=Bergeyella porcorum TaxID=1735111 RepID=A0AAU0F4B6_9FLAO